MISTESASIQLPFEFAVVGKPISHQTKNKTALRDWKLQVLGTAKKMVGCKKPTGIHCQVTITHFFDSDEWETGVPDSDNIVKPVRDALQGIIYVDDYQVSDFVSRRRDINKAFRIRGMSPPLAYAFTQGDEFLYIKIEAAPEPQFL
jgi:Holliday junction resolvase RusA-like endonuclease